MPMQPKLVSGIDICYQLRRLGWTQSALARDLGVSPSLVNNIIHDRATGYRVAVKISKILGNDLETLWPVRYAFKPRNTVKEEGRQC